MISFETTTGLTFHPARISILEDGIEIGFYLLVPHSQELWEVHTHFYPQGYGKAFDIGQQAIDWFYSVNPNIKTLITKVPEYNKLAKMLTLKSGFKKCGDIPFSYLHNGKMINQELYYFVKEN